MMKQSMQRIARATLLVLSTLPVIAVAVQAHEEGYGSANLAPRVGRMSDEVIMQRLRIAGIENPLIINRSGNNVTARGQMGGREVRLEVQALSGKVFELNQRQRRQIIGGAIQEASPLIRGQQILVERDKLADPVLGRDAMTPERLIRPN